jgi:hypothetical protein
LRAVIFRGLLGADTMSHYMIHAGGAGFLLALALNHLAGNDWGPSIMRGCVAALAFAMVARWFMRGVFTELHLSLYEQQVAAQQQPAPGAEAEAGDAPEPGADA